MLKNWIHTIFQVHSGSAALTVKAKKGGSGRTNGSRQGLCVTLGYYKWTDKWERERDRRRRLCVLIDGVWSSEVSHVPVVCPAGVWPAVHAVSPVSLPWPVSGRALLVPGRPDRREKSKNHECSFQKKKVSLKELRDLWPHDCNMLLINVLKS